MSSGENIATTGNFVCVYKPPIQLVAKTSLYLPSFLVDTHKCTQMPLFRRHSDGRWWFCLVSVLSRIQRVRCASAPTAPLRSFLPSSLLQDLRATRLNPWCVHACVWECLMGRGFEGKQYLSFLWIKRGGGGERTRAVGWSFYDFSEFQLFEIYALRLFASMAHERWP